MSIRNCIIVVAGAVALIGCTNGDFDPIQAQKILNWINSQRDRGDCPDNTATAYFAADGKTLALWRFNEGAGNVAVDVSGRNHTLALENGPAWVSSPYGKALSFSSGDCRLADANDLFPSTITVEALVKVDAYPPAGMSPRSHSMIVSTVSWNYGSTGAAGYELRLTDSEGKVEFTFGNNNAWHSAFSERKLEIGKWYRIAGQYDGKRILLYVDGELWAGSEYEGAISPGWEGLTVARRVGDQPFYFYGQIDEVRISDGARF